MIPYRAADIADLAVTSGPSASNVDRLRFLFFRRTGSIRKSVRILSRAFGSISVDEFYKFTRICIGLYRKSWTYLEKMNLE